MGVDSVFGNHEVSESRITEIIGHIVRVYDELEVDDSAVQKVEENLKDRIKRLESYYRELHSKGEFKEERTGRVKSLNEICRTILAEMDRRHITSWSKNWVWVTLPDDCKRAWRKPVVDNVGKLEDKSLLSIDNEVETIYDQQIDLIKELHGFDYNELPKSRRLMLAEQFYKMYRYHEREWQKHGITVVKHEDGLNIPDPFAGIIRVEEGQPYEGELEDSLKGLKKTLTAFIKKIHTGILDKEGNRIVTLEREHELAMGVRVLDGYFKPHANYKWKRDIPRWASLLLKKFELKSKSGAEKYSRETVSRDFYDFDQMFKEDPERGVTREEIAKMQKRLCVFFLQFIKHHPGLMALADVFAEVSEEKRAAHSIKMNAKLSDRA